MRRLFLILSLFSCLSIFAAAPTTQATNVVYSNVTTNSFTVSWTRGNGANCVVFIKQTTTTRSTPANNTTYTANTVYGSGTQIGTTGWYCIYNGTGTSVNVTGLATNITYRVHVCEYNGGVGAQMYLTTAGTGNPANRATSNFIAPTIQATNVIYSNVSYNTFTISCTKGNGDYRVFFIKQIATGRSTPANNTTYTANTVYGSGTQIGTTGWYCIYNGTGNSVTVTGLSANITYRVHVSEYNGTAGNQKYLTTASTNNPFNQLTQKYTSWNGTTWSAGVPDATTYTVVNGNYSGTSLITKQLVINSPYILTIGGGVTLTTNGKVNVNGNLILISNGTSDGSFINNDSVIGNVTVQKYITPNQWHLISDPVKNYLIDSIKQYYPQLYDEPNNKFTRTWLTTGIMTTNLGYGIWSRNNPATISFKGNVNYQSSINLTKSSQGYNMIGNPYTSCLDWESASWDRTNISGTIWIWNGVQYATYTAGVGGTNGGVRYIAVGQGFFVQATTNNISFTLTSGARVHQPTNLLKSMSMGMSVDTINQLIRIGVNNVVYSDECILAFRDSASNGYDPRYDAHKILGSVSAPQIFFQNDTNKLTVNSIKDDLDSIPFRININYNQSCNISITNQSSRHYKIYDKLNDTSYVGGFSTSINVNDTGRFYLLKYVPVVIDTTPKDTIPKDTIPSDTNKISLDHNKINPLICVNGGSVIISNLVETDYIQIVDLNGIEIKNLEAQSDRYSISLNTGFYVVRIYNQTDSYTQKIIIR